MTIIVTAKDLTKPLADIEADRKKLKDYLKPAIAETVKAATNVWFFNQGRFTRLKGGRTELITEVVTLGAGHTSVFDKLLDA